MIAQNNATHIVVGKDISLATSGARSALSTGQVGIFKNGSGAASATALVAGDGFVASIKDADGNIKSTPYIKYSDIISKSAKTYAAPTQKKVYFGFNGTTGAITAANSSTYIVRVVLKDNTATFFQHPLYETADYNSDASATEEEIALGVVASMAKNFTSLKPHKVTVVQPGLINSSAVVATNDFINNATVVSGTNAVSSAGTKQIHTITLSGSSGTANVAAAGGLTKLATFTSNLQTSAANFVTSHAAAYAAVGIVLTTTSTGATDGKLVFTAAVEGAPFTAPTITNATGDLAGSVGATQANVPAFTYATNTAIAVGDYLRIGGVGLGTALTSNVYKVRSISGTTGTSYVVLDRPIVEASGTYAAATSDIEVIPAATAAAADFGISLTGLALPFKPGMVKYEVLDFEVLLNDPFGSTPITVATTPSKGTGSYQEVAELEWFLKANRGEVNRVALYPVDNVLAATSGKTYAIVTVNYKVADTKYLDRNIAQTATLMFATETDSSGAAHTNLKTVFSIS